MNNTVYFNPEWMEALGLLDEDTRNAVISGIVAYQISGKVSDAVASMASFVLLRIEVDRRNRRIARERQRRRGCSVPQSADSVAQPCEVAASQPAEPFHAHHPAPVAADVSPEPDVFSELPQRPSDAPERARRPDLTPEKKAAIASLVESLMQPRTSPPHRVS